MLALPILLFDLTSPPAPPAKPSMLEEVTRRVDLYGRFDGYVGMSGDNPEIKNNSSRFGIKAQQSIAGDVTVFAQAEWKMNLGAGDTTYNVSENPDTGLGTVTSTTNQALSTRLGYVGLRFGKYGELTLGKQWGVYYDVSKWTDRFVVFGAHGSSTYNAGTDGGQTGEGRADGALAYRVSLGPLRLGLQTQFLPRSPRVDSVSGSVVYETKWGFRAGIAYSRAMLAFTTPVVGYDGGDAQAFTGGVNYDARNFFFSAVNTWTKHHEIVNAGSTAVMYDTLGAELIASYRIEGVLMPYGGYDFAVPRGLDTRFVSPDYGTRDFLAGLRWIFEPKAKTFMQAQSFVYLECRTGQTRDVNGTRAENVVALGIRYEFSLRRALGLD